MWSNCKKINNIRLILAKVLRLSPLRRRSACARTVQPTSTSRGSDWRFTESGRNSKLSTPAAAFLLASLLKTCSYHYGRYPDPFAVLQRVPCRGKVHGWRGGICNFVGAGEWRQRLASDDCRANLLGVFSLTSNHRGKTRSWDLI